MGWISVPHHPIAAPEPEAGDDDEPDTEEGMIES